MLNTPNPRVCSGWSAYFCTAAATAEIYTLSLHDALPILQRDAPPRGRRARRASCTRHHDRAGWNLERPVPGAAVHLIAHEVVDGRRARKDRSGREDGALAHDRALVHAAAAAHQRVVRSEERRVG